MFNKLKEYLKKIFFNIEDDFKLWDGRLYKLEQMPNGEFKEVELGKNKVLLSGLQATCKHLFNKEFKIEMNSFERNLYNEAEVVNDLSEVTTTPGSIPFIKGYNVLYDGSVGTDVVPYDKHKKGYTFDQMVPFRCINIELAKNMMGALMSKYAHYRIKTYHLSNGQDVQYVEFFTKKIDINYTVTTADGLEVSVNEPDENLVTDKDIRCLASFTINIEEEELSEWFNLNNKGKSEASGYNAVATMWGTDATMSKFGTTFNTISNCYVFSRVNHAFVPHGVDGTITCIYKMRLI